MDFGFAGLNKHQFDSGSSIRPNLDCILYAVQNFNSVKQFLKCDHSNESISALLSRGLFVMLCKVVLTFGSNI